MIADATGLRELLGIDFSEQQLAAITAPVDEPQAIIAGAGSGKTTVMAARVVWLVGHEDVDPERILGLTFTVKAAAELGGRVRSALAMLGDFRESGEPTVSTYHAFAGSLITEHGLRLGIESDLRLLADASRFQLAAKVVRSHRGPLEAVSWWMPVTINDVLALDAQLSEHLVDTDALRRHDADLAAEVQGVPKRLKIHEQILGAVAKRAELSRLVDEYRRAKIGEGVMDFSDQMAAGAALARLPQVGEAMRERFAVVLLDEYQDTSVAQRVLLQSLFAGHGIAAVGDPAQGIYGWRGAASGNLIGFLDDFPAADGARGRLHSLDVSRRCAPEILDLANRVAAPYYGDPEVARVVTPLSAALQNPPGRVTAALHETVADEVADVVARVVEAGGRRPWRQIAVLVRASGENERLAQALRSAGVPVEIVGLTGLLDEPEVLDVLAVLELLEDLTANPALLRLLTGPRWRVGDRDLALLGRRAALLGRGPGEPDDADVSLGSELDKATRGVDPTEVVSLAEALEDPGDLGYSPQALARFAELAALLRRMRRHAHEPLLDLARRAVTELDLDVELPVDGVPPDNLGLLFDAVATYSRNDRYASLGGLLAYLRAERDYNDGMELSAPTEAESVKLLTIHKAKGLEFDEVLVPFVSGGVFPSDQGRANWLTSAAALPAALRGDAQWLPQCDDVSTGKAVEEYKRRWRADAALEEVRLCYVAFTRARGRLHVSGHRWGRTQVRPRRESAFMAVTREWLADHGQSPDAWAPEPAPDDVNPQITEQAHQWPVELSGVGERRRFADEVRARLDTAEPLPMAVHPRLRAVRAELDLLIDEARRQERRTIEVTVPGTLSATDAMALAADENAFARELARPVPRRPSPAARFGTAFHAWLEARFGQQPLLDPAELPGRGDHDIADDEDLAALKAAFEAGPFASRVPVAVEVPFAVALGDHRIVGRIDAVFERRDGPGWEVVDWKTSHRQDADPLQLAIYRLAWAQRQGLDPELVTGTFCYVRLGTSTTIADLPGAEAIEAALRLR